MASTRNRIPGKNSHIDFRRRETNSNTMVHRYQVVLANLESKIDIRQALVSKVPKLEKLNENSYGLPLWRDKF